MIQTFEADFESTYIKGIFYHAFLQTLKDVKKIYDHYLFIKNFKY